MPADILQLADDLKGELDTLYTGLDPAVTVLRDYYVTVQVDRMTGRNVWLFPLGYGNEGPSTRQDDTYDFTLGVVYAEKWTSTGLPSKSWVDERILFVEEQIYVPLCDGRRFYGAGENYWSQTADVTLVYNVDYLRDFKLFWSELQFTYRKTK